MMSSNPEIILDASAIIAYINEERGADIVEQWLPKSAVSMVNISEVISVLVRDGNDEAEVSGDVRALVPRIVPYSWDIARLTGAMITETEPKGLGLGDRAALATAKIMKIPVLTTEERWLDVPVGVDVRLIRRRRPS